MERRVLLAIFLAFIVLYTWQALFVKPVPKPVAGSATTTATSASTGTTPANTASELMPETSASATPSAPLAPALVADTAEREVRVETRDVIAVFTNKGARLKSWRLK